MTISFLGITISIATAWLIAAIILAIIEAITLGLTCIWFAGGAVAAAVCALAGGPVLLQIVVFLAVSCLLLIFTRPLARRKLNARTEKTNADALIGREAIVIDSIGPHSTGQVRIDGLVWTAAAQDAHAVIEKDTTVTILEIRGVKLIVAPVTVSPIDV